MLYTKPKIKFTEMAMYVDDHIKDIIVPNKNKSVEDTIFKYLYALYYMLACKHRYFHKYSDYDNFSFYAATRLYVKLRDNYNRQGQQRRGKKIEPIKSCLNFIKKTIYWCKVDYQKEFFNLIIDGSSKTGKETKIQEGIEDYMRQSVVDDYREDLFSALLDSFDNLPGIAIKVLSETFYKKDSLEYNNIYLSCVLTLLNRFTLVETIESNKKNYSYPMLEKLYHQEETTVILWHLNSSMYDFISLLVNKIKKELNNTIEDTQTYYELDDSIVDTILDSNFGKNEIENPLGDWQ